MGSNYLISLKKVSVTLLVDQSGFSVTNVDIQRDDIMPINTVYILRFNYVKWDVDSYFTQYLLKILDIDIGIYCNVNLQTLAD